MLIRSTLSIALTALFAFSMGCAVPETSEADAFPLDEVPYSTMAGEGTGSGNHLNSVDLYGNKLHLFHSAEAPLTTYNAAENKYYVASTPANNSLLSTTGGRDVLKYAIKCAIPAGKAIYYTTKGVNGQTVLNKFIGGGILISGSWHTTGLSTDRIQDLMACVAAHLNSDGAYIDINLLGKRVNNTLTSTQASEYDWDEAFWVAKVGYQFNATVGLLVPYVNLKAYPLRSAVSGGTSCMTVGMVNVDAMTRSCDVDGNNCNVLTGDADSDCFVDETTGVWYCKNTSTTYVPAIKTRLKSNMLPVDYVDCPMAPIEILPEPPGIIYEYY